LKTGIQIRSDIQQILDASQKNLAEQLADYIIRINRESQSATGVALDKAKEWPKWFKTDTGHLFKFDDSETDGRCITCNANLFFKIADTIRLGHEKATLITTAEAAQILEGK
jgi:hypothetical protein